MRPLTIELQRLEAALDNREPTAHYLDLETGAILAVAPAEPVPGETDKYGIEPERYLLIEPLETGEHLAMREDFLFSLDDPHAHTALRLALESRKPLRTFDYELERFPAARLAWAMFRDEALREYALEWLLENGLEQAGG